jgi:predicted nucleic acid-binding protein
MPIPEFGKHSETWLISILTYMEILTIKDFLSDFGFTVLPLTENIGHRAAIYIEEYALACQLRAGDALVAATAVESNLPLTTSNAKALKIEFLLYFPPKMWLLRRF